MSENNAQGVLAIAKEFGLEGLVSVGLDFIPFLSSFNNMRKFNRLERRMKESNTQLNRIGQLSHNSVLAAEYISERIFPIVLADLIEEHEDAKINLILTGFENVFIEEKSEESIVINYYDTLRNLRYKDIKRFWYLVGVTDSFERHLINTEEAAIITSIDRKLERYGLIEIQWDDLENGEYEFVSPSHIKETHYGHRFLQFILSNEEKVAES
ncbi:hypothetical protein [Bacillus thuringiensis]|uniref:hypothetical protein n=1 Tax=Bacillus thuringiensis TaxID=1428 RepID=UPI000BFC7F10|nr:hypothetical protein [Bacillus thuringiensis]PGU16735.1 hypothetical protein COD22_27215 [Bacillus thuringiensis]